MGKFNMTKINGIGAETNETGTRAGAGLLSEISKQLVSEDMRIVYLDRSQIQTNPRNFYSIEKIASLARSIQFAGLGQPLEVIQNADGTYMLTGGERRLTAIDKLIEDGNWDKKIPCVLKDLDNVKLPLDDADKETFSIITVNREQRDYTDADTAREIAELQGIYKRLKERGIDFFELDGGERIEIKGKKTRELVAETLGISTGQVSNFEKVANRGSSALKESLLNNELSIGTAVEVASLPQTEQNELLEKVKREKDGKIEKADVRKFQKEKKAEHLKKTEKSDTIISEEKKKLTKSDWLEDTAGIRDALEKIEIELDEKQYGTYQDCVKKLTNLLNEVK